jgi:carboxylesterase
VFIVGVSMGGLLALRLAETRRVDALVVIGTPLVLAPPIPQVLPWIQKIFSFRRKGQSDIQDAAARAEHPTIAAMPLAAVAQMIALQAEVIAELDRVEAPILVAHGLLDKTARPRDAERIHAAVRSREKELFLLKRSGHIVTVDHDRAALATAAADFLGRR